MCLIMNKAQKQNHKTRSKHYSVYRPTFINNNLTETHINIQCCQYKLSLWVIFAKNMIPASYPVQPKVC